MPSVGYFGLLWGFCFQSSSVTKDVMASAKAYLVRSDISRSLMASIAGVPTHSGQFLLLLGWLEPCLQTDLLCDGKEITLNLTIGLEMVG